MKSKLSEVKTKVVLKNLYSLSKYDLHKSDLDLQEALRQLIVSMDDLQNYCYQQAQRIDDLQNRLKLEEVLRYYAVHREKALNYHEELEYLENSGEIVAFPYEKQRQMGDVVSGYDLECEMPFVIHAGKRLYFPVGWTESAAIVAYKNYIENENLLGGNYRKKSPHQYQTEDFKIESGDVLVDVGCAEGLLSLDVIEKIKKAYLIESDSKWIPALNKTFEPFKEKVVIVNKYLTDKDTDTMVTLSRVLSDEKGASFFLKMDIEGYESMVLKSSKRFFMEQQCKVVCCTYHKAEDEAIVSSFFENIGYFPTFSDGYVLFLYGDEWRPPYFRRGIVRAKRK